jgi:hypothetical protein
MLQHLTVWTVARQSNFGLLDHDEQAGYIAQWLERLTADQQVPGSNPGVPFMLFLALLTT